MMPFGSAGGSHVTSSSVGEPARLSTLILRGSVGTEGKNYKHILGKAFCFAYKLIENNKI